MAANKTGILLVNLGSPEAPTTKAVRRFLKEFLWDPRVVNIPRPIWWLILHLFVLPLRPARSAKAYQKIWTENGSPLVVLTKQLAGKLADKLSSDEILCTYAMRYGKPSIAEQLSVLKQHGASNVVVLPLYPQYSSTTTASIYDDFTKELKRWRHLPRFHFISDYHQNEHYLEAVVASVKAHWESHGKHDMLVMSFHGLPELLTKLGDPYYTHCQTTARLIAERLSLKEQDWMLVFQSRFGKAEWLKPYCAETLEKLPQQGVKSVDIICPGFAVDCLETLEEIAMENKHVFLAAGGREYRYIPALNDSDAHVNVMVKLLGQWI